MQARIRRLCDRSLRLRGDPRSSRRAESIARPRAQDFVRSLVGSQQGFDPSPQIGVVPAGRVQVGRPRGARFMVEGRDEDRLHVVSGSVHDPPRSDGFTSVPAPQCSVFALRAPAEMNSSLAQRLRGRFVVRLEASDSQSRAKTGKGAAEASYLTTGPTPEVSAVRLLSSSRRRQSRRLSSRLRPLLVGDRCWTIFLELESFNLVKLVEVVSNFFSKSFRAASSLLRSKSILKTIEMFHLY